MSPFYYEHSEDMSNETAYEAYFEIAHKESCVDSCEDSGQTFGLWNLPTRQVLSIDEQDDLWQQRLRDEKREDHQNVAFSKNIFRMAALAAARARIGRTVDEQRNLFHEKSRVFALDSSKARAPLPVEVGSLTLRQFAFQRSQTVSMPTAPVVAPVSMAVPVVLIPFVESGCGAMFEIL